MKKIKLFLGFILLAALVSCSALQSALQIVNCKYDIEGVANPAIAGVSLNNIKNLNQIKAMDLVKLTAAFATKNFPLSLTINIKATNPGNIAATVQRIDWAIDLEQKEILNGAINQSISVPANGGSTIIPVSVGTDMLQLFSGETKDNLLNLALNIANVGESSSKISIRIKPTVVIGGQPITTGFITLNKTITSK
ncbi:MAG: LEA type 2 family protein [Prevotellaceae bacterium]|jgi:LEA14-like dessication related protein|nr:LEA type 2 family protein [Prevotellaceae bacterium]